MAHLISQSIGQGTFRSYDSLEHAYAQYYGAITNLIPVPNIPNRVLDLILSTRPKGIILTGGSNPEGLTQRDQTEYRLLASAEKERIPVLGICRGLTIMNRYFGGTDVAVGEHVRDNHAVTVADETLAAKIGRIIHTNSYHNYAVTDATLAPPLVALAYGPGNTIELLQHRTLPMIAVQWHPERPNEDQVASDAIVQAALAGHRL